jgi:hypothetical protein
MDEFGGLETSYGILGFQGMSGGDYDGDMAWVCWNEDLVSSVQPSIDDFGFDHPFTKDLGRAAFLQASQRTRCILTRLFCLFSGRRTVQKGIALRGDIDEEMIRTKKWPHWKSRATVAVYHSKKVLAKICDHTFCIT